MELLDNLALGLGTALQPENVLYCLIGVVLGTAVGVLPGIGPTATIAMLLPITFSLEPVAALIMLAGIYYGAQYGGSTTAILINLPGESSAAVTAIDGHEMALKGRAGPALAAAALGSFFAGTVATVVLAVAAPPLARVALRFGPAEYFSLVVLGLLASIALARGSTLKALAMIVESATVTDSNGSVVPLANLHEDGSLSEPASEPADDDSSEPQPVDDVAVEAGEHPAEEQQQGSTA